MAFDTVNRILNGARVLLAAKSITSLDGVSANILDWSQPATQQLTNSAWRKLQARLAERRYSGLKKELVFSGVPISATGDPSKQSFIDYGGFWDGAAMHEFPALPAALLRPYELSERLTVPAGPLPPQVVFGGASYSLIPGQLQIMPTANFTAMDEFFDVLPRAQKKAWNLQWIWRDGKVFLPGALSATDICLTYGELRPDFVDNGNTAWIEAQVPLLNCADAFSEYIVREVMVASGDVEKAAAMDTSAEAAVQLMLNQDAAIIPAEGGQ